MNTVAQQMHMLMAIELAPTNDVPNAKPCNLAIGECKKNCDNTCCLGMCVKLIGEDARGECVMDKTKKALMCMCHYNVCPPEL